MTLMVMISNHLAKKYVSFISMHELFVFVSEISM